jgi:hypothetical protein
MQGLTAALTSDLLQCRKLAWHCAGEVSAHSCCDTGGQCICCGKQTSGHTLATHKQTQSL